MISVFDAALIEVIDVDICKAMLGKFCSVDVSRGVSVTMAPMDTSRPVRASISCRTVTPNSKTQKCQDHDVLEFTKIITSRH